jgi:hypothetical protein
MDPAIPMSGPISFTTGNIRYLKAQGASRPKFVPGAEPGETALTVIPGGSLRAREAVYEAATSLTLTGSPGEFDAVGVVFWCHFRSPSVQNSKIDVVSAFQTLCTYFRELDLDHVVELHFVPMKATKAPVFGRSFNDANLQILGGDADVLLEAVKQ